MSNRNVLHRSFVVAALSIAAAVGVYSAMPAYAQDAGNKAPPAERPAGERRQSIEGAMKQAERAYKALARQLDDASKDDQSLRAISQFQAGIAVSKGMVPHSIEDKPEADRPAALAEYRKMMLEVLKTAIDLEEKLVAGDRAAAKAALEKLHELEEQGHKKFAPEDHDH